MGASPPPGKRYRILVCRGPECGDRRGSARVYAALDALVQRRPPGCPAVVLGWQSCFGHCRRGPNVLVREMRPNEDPFFATFLTLGAGPGAALYHGVTPADAPRILDEHVGRGHVIEELKLRNTDLPKK